MSIEKPIRRAKYRLASLGGIIAGIAWLMGTSMAEPPSATDADANRDRPTFLQEPALTESSGLAFSRRDPACVWTHNDSGGAAVLYAFDLTGNPTGRVKLDLPSEPVDWEDMAAFTIDGQPKLLVADCGDNQAKRSRIMLHLFDEPDPRQTADLRPALTIQVTYPDGPRDCEAVTVDERSGQIWLFTKSFLPKCDVYSITMPQWGDGGETSAVQTLVATKRLTLTIPLITAADIDVATGDLFLTGYFQAYHYRRGETAEPLETFLRRLPEPIPVPPLKQIEALAIDSTGQAWVTSEGHPTAMQRLTKPATQSKPADAIPNDYR